MSRLWQSRLDCWYQPIHNPGAKPKKAVRWVAYVLLEAVNSDEAIKAAIEWADSKTPGSKGRKLVAIEHRSTSSVSLPLQLADKWRL